MEVDESQNDTSRSLADIISEKIRRKEKIVEQLIQESVARSQHRLDERFRKIQEGILLAERQRECHKNNLTSSQIDFINKVDECSTKALQTSAYRMFTRAKISKLTPSWITCLDEVCKVVSMYGHDDKLRWRGRSSKILSDSLVQAAADPLAADHCSRIRKLIMSINLKSSNEFLREVRMIQAEFLEERRREVEESSEQGLLADYSASLSTFSTGLYDSSASRSLSPRRWKASKVSKREENRGPDERPAARTVQPEQFGRVLHLLRHAAVAGDIREAWKIYRSEVDPPGQSPRKDKIKNESQIFRLLMMTFKNSQSGDYRIPERIFRCMETAGVEPDLSVYNLLLSSCVRESKWRRALGYYKDLRRRAILPNTNTFEILLSCCRHAIDEPAAIFETLRLADLPVNFCYKSAICNAGNRISTQVIIETLQDHADDSSTSISSERQWKLVAAEVRRTLAPRSPSRSQHAPRIPSFETSLSRSMSPFAQSMEKLLPDIKTSSTFDYETREAGADDFSVFELSSQGSQLVTGTIDDRLTGYNPWNDIDIDDSLQLPSIVLSSISKQEKSLR